MITKLKKYFNKKKHWLYRNIYYRLSPRFFYISPRIMANMWYAYRIGSLPNIRNPKNVNELWISLNLKAMKDECARKLRIRCADKYAVRQYIAEKGYAETLNECYGVYNSFDEINFDALPNQFVLKLTSGSGMNYICRDKSQLNLDDLRRIVDKWYENIREFGLKTAEWHYVEIKPRLIVEKYLSMLGESKSLIDYKFHCFNGQIYHIETIYDRDIYKHTLICDTYTTNWERKETIKHSNQVDRRMLPTPRKFEYMKHMAEVLSADFEYVRVDMYEIEDQVLFGELTFTPSACIEYDYSEKDLEEMCRFYHLTKK